MAKQGRRPDEVRRSLMTGVAFGRDDQELSRRLVSSGRSAADLRAQGLVAGTGNEIVAQLGELAAVGVQRVMLQWLDLDDLDGLEALATNVLSQLT